MKRVLVSVVLVTQVACFGGSSPSPAAEGDAGGGGGAGGGATSNGGGGTSSNGGGSSSGGGGSSSGGAADGGAGCTSIALTPQATGYVDATSLNVVGAWFAYGDDLGATGAPPGQCETVGKHPASACSSVTSPAPAADGGTASFPQSTPGTMCLSGTAAKVIGVPPDYANVFGIGMGLDLNNPSGTPLTYDAQTNHVTGFTFTVAGLPTDGTVRVELQEPATDATGDAWSYTLTGDGTVTVQLKSGTGPGELSPAFKPPTGTTQPPFDPSKLEAIQFHVVTSTTSAVSVSNFCISDLAAIVCP